MAFSACSSSDDEPDCVADVDCADGQCVEGVCAPLDEQDDAGEADASQDAAEDAATDADDACSGDACSEGPVCDPGFHECGESCVDSSSPETCGDRCDPCPGDPNGTATCTEASCGIECDEPYVWDDAAMACVECSSDQDCTDPSASSCSDAGECVACVSEEDCSHLDGASICWDGTCSECSTEDPSACGENSCDPSTGQCTNVARGSVAACQECVADSECADDHVCVPMDFDDTPRQKTFCLPLAAPDCERPYPTPVTRQSVGGESVDVCTINEQLTTCEAVTQYGASCADASDCGADGLSDGLCEPIDFDTAACTFPCTSDGECPTMSMMGCAPNGSLEYCGAW